MPHYQRKIDTPPPVPLHRVILSPLGIVQDFELVSVPIKQIPAHAAFNAVVSSIAATTTDDPHPILIPRNLVTFNSEILNCIAHH